MSPEVSLLLVATVARVLLLKRNRPASMFNASPDDCWLSNCNFNWSLQRKRTWRVAWGSFTPLSPSPLPPSHQGLRSSTCVNYTKSESQTNWSSHDKSETITCIIPFLYNLFQSTPQFTDHFLRVLCAIYGRTFCGLNSTIRITVMQWLPTVILTTADVGVDTSVSLIFLQTSDIRKHMHLYHHCHMYSNQYTSCGIQDV